MNKMDLKLGVKDTISKSVGKSLTDGEITLSGRVDWVLRDSEGNIKDARYDVPNLITNVGKAFVADLLLADVGSAAPTVFDYIAIGTGTNAAAATDTTLQTEITTNGGARAAATGTRVTTTVTNDTAQLVLTFTFTGAFAVTESGVFNDVTTGTMLCRQVFSAINVASSDSLQVTWKIAIS